MTDRPAEDGHAAAAAGEASSGLPARRVAYDVLNAVFFRRRTLDEAYDPRSATGQAFAALPPRDRGFVRVLVSTVLKRAGGYDDKLETFLRDGVSGLTPPQLLTILRLGLAQIDHLNTPPHAAVDTSVSLAEDIGMTSQKSLVNAVLRRAVREKFPPPAPRDAGRRMLPEWLWSIWVNDYGVETALDIAEALLDDAPVDFTLRDSSPESQRRWAGILAAEVLPQGSLRKPAGGFIPSLDGFEEGAWWVQNAAAAVPATMLEARPGMTVVDLCAAPGGKTAQLAAAGATVIAVDRSAPRLARLEENMRRLRLTERVRVIAADGAVWQPDAAVDAVLLDAPCTATGTLRHQPDALWLKTPADLQKLSALQARLLANAVAMLKPGGRLVYCTCSLQKEEGEEQIERLLSGMPGVVARAPLTLPFLPEAVTAQGDLRILPQHAASLGGMDGFFIARLQKAR